MTERPSPSNEFAGEAAEDVKPLDIIGMLVRRGWLIVLAALLGSGLSYLNFTKKPPIYQSNCSLLIVKQNTSEQISVRGIDSPGQDSTPHHLLIRSPLVVDAAIKKFQLNQLSSFAGQLEITGRIIAGLSVAAENGRGTMMNLSFRERDPGTCEKVLTAIVSSYKDFLGSTQESISKQTVDLITDAKDTLMEQLNEREAAYQAFRQEAPLLWTSGQSSQASTNIHQARLAGIEGARASLIIERSKIKAQLTSVETALAAGGNRAALQLVAAISSRGDAADVSSGGSGRAKSPEAELFPMLLEEQMLLDTLGPDHPKLGAIQRRIRITRDFLLKNVGYEEGEIKSATKKGPVDFLSIYIESLRQQIEAASEKLRELDTLFEDEREAAKKLTLWEVKDVTHRNDIGRIQQLFSGVVKRLEEINLLKNSGGFKAETIAPPSPGYQVAPVFSQYMSVGLIAGILAGVILAYLLEVNDKSFRNPAEISSQLRLSIIGHIPVIPRDPVRDPDAKLDGSLVTFFRPKSRLSEAYRAIRTALYFSTRGEPHKVIQVTSPNPGDGKSTMSANLAISIAQTGKKVLLIDADFRRPRVHKLFGLESKVGMTSVISGEMEIIDAVQATEVPDLYILPCGPKPNNPCELLTSRRFEELVSLLREQYDFVIIDTPPLLAVTDPGAVAARVDGVLLTIRISKRTRNEAMRAAELLASVGANTIGVIVNGVGTGNGYGYGYGYGYRYNSYNYGNSYGYSYRYSDAKSGSYYIDEDKPSAKRIANVRPTPKN